jgi:membrane-bound lytic murein transglycosylase D
MTVKKSILFLFLFGSIHLFSQTAEQRKWILKKEINTSYLDSIKNTFVKNDTASRIDSLWTKELASLDVFNSLTDDIKTINIDEKVDFDLPTDLLKSRLKLMDAKSPFHIEYNLGLENIIKSFLKNRKKSFERLMSITDYYFPMFEEALAKQNIPLEIKYLAVVESSLNPKAVSKMGATGLWQFMYETGKQYNLKIDSYIDERCDPLKSSEAAASYFSKMYGVFGDWDLVLASYNSGPGNVAKAIRRSNGQQNYWNIRKNLPKETQGYLPAFLATMYIFEYHKEHGIKPNKSLIKHFSTDTIMLKRQMTFKQISDLVDVPESELQLLNPSYKLNVIPVYEGKNHFLRLPKDKIATFVSNEDRIYAYVQHEFELREKPFQSDNSGIAAAFTEKKTKPSPAENRIKGTKKETKSDNLPTEIASNSAPYYLVQKGDNLGAIAKNHNVTVAELKEWNHLSDTNIQLGASLQVAKTKEVASNTKLENTEYVVQKGDNLSKIASKFCASLEDLKSWNAIENNSISIGSTLIVSKNDVVVVNTMPADSFKKKDNLAAISKKNLKEYFVKKGDSLFSISKKYPGVSVSDIKKWNDIQEEAAIKPGMKLKING